MNRIVDETELRWAIDALKGMEKQIISPHVNVFSRILTVFQALLAEHAGDEAMIESKSQALDAVNEGRGLADDDLWAHMKAVRDIALQACRAMQAASIAGGRAFDEAKMYEALQLANKALRGQQ